jgi:hypothetical protein
MVIIGYIVYIHIILIWLYIFCIYIFYGYNPYNYGYTLKTRTALTSIHYVYGLLPEPTHVFMFPTVTENTRKLNLNLAWQWTIR